MLHEVVNLKIIAKNTPELITNISSAIVHRL